MTTPECYVPCHDADVVRASIVAQQKKRDRDKNAQAALRKRQEAKTGKGSAVSADISDYAVSQTDKQTAVTGIEEQ